ncbi:Bifunctional cytokinin biosynthesis protein [Claviceps cyperi]|nr:Bifunctional cytokinin biosynthesis protein [Claviceps cyperi]
MHTRKRLMTQMVREGAPGSGFVVLSGGYGTLKELLEAATWLQLDIHRCGVSVFSVDGFHDGLLDWIRRVAGHGFVGNKDADNIRVGPDDRILPFWTLLEM